MCKEHGQRPQDSKFWNVYLEWLKIYNWKFEFQDGHLLPFSSCIWDNDMVTDDSVAIFCCFPHSIAIQCGFNSQHTNVLSSIQCLNKLILHNSKVLFGMLAIKDHHCFIAMKLAIENVHVEDNQKLSLAVAQ